MAGTVAVVVITHDLSLGVAFGVVLSALLFSRQVAKRVDVTSTLDSDTRTRTYHVRGQLFFASADDLLAGFDLHEDVDAVVIDLSAARAWDATSVAAIDKLVLRWRVRGVPVRLHGADAQTGELLARLAVHDRPGATLPSH